MKYLIQPLFAVILFVCTGCPEEIDPADSKILIINNSDKEIVHYDELKNPSDTTLLTIAFPQTPENTESRTIQANDTSIEEAGFRRILSNNPDKVYMFYLFSRDTIEQVPWERIVEENLVLRRYDLTLDSLEARNWTITYP